MTMDVITLEGKSEERFVGILKTVIWDNGLNRKQVILEGEADPDDPAIKTGFLNTVSFFGNVRHEQTGEFLFRSLVNGANKIYLYGFMLKKGPSALEEVSFKACFDAYEIAIVTPDKVIRSEIYEKYRDNEQRIVNINSHAFDINDFIQSLDIHAFVFGFNQVSNYAMEWFNIEQLIRDYVEPDVEDNLPAIDIESLLPDHYERDFSDGYGYITRQGNDLYVRIYRYLQSDKRGQYDAEISRMVIPKDGSPKFLINQIGRGFIEEPLVNVYPKALFIDLLGWDELEGTRLEYMGKYLKMVDSDTTALVLTSVIFKSFENLLNMGYRDFAASLIGKRYYLPLISYDLDNFNIRIENKVKLEAVSFKDVLGVPEFMVDYLATKPRHTRNKAFGCLYNLLGEDRLAHMDKEHFRKCMEAADIIEWQAEEDIYDSLSVLYHMTQTDYLRFFEYIYKNMYKDEAKEEVDNEFIQTFDDYILIMYQLHDKNRIEPLEWKVPKKNLENRHDFVSNLYYELHQEKMDEDVSRKFEKTVAGWKKYGFEHNDLVIISPKKPSELVREGQLLHHCVGSYVDAVANDRTVILFIRRKDEPDKPYFTLEVRDNKIRQCHGRFNSNADEEIEEFLKQFCKAKSVTYDDGTALLLQGG